MLFLTLWNRNDTQTTDHAINQFVANAMKMAWCMFLYSFSTDSANNDYLSLGHGENTLLACGTRQCGQGVF